MSRATIVLRCSAFREVAAISVGQDWKLSRKTVERERGIQGERVNECTSGEKRNTQRDVAECRKEYGWLHLCSYIINTHNSLGSTKEERRPKIVIFYPLLCPSHDVTITLLMPLLCPLLADFPSPLDILFNAA